MNDRPFFDTNIVVYAYVDDLHTARAEELLTRGGFISVQVLNEFVRTMRRKQRSSWDEIQWMTTSLRTMVAPPLPVALETHEKAITVAERYGFEFFDCLIVAAALQASCTTLYTEDLQHGQVIEGLTVRNPFIS
jgi:predicted nucleic acid-binding protein